jgi:hypothetical protein
MNRRHLLKTAVASTGGALLSSCARGRQPRLASDAELAAVLREFGGVELAPGEAARIRKAIRESRFEIKVDPEVQPECDFDPEVEP